MLQYNHKTSEIARPSEVLHGIQAFMSALRSSYMVSLCYCSTSYGSTVYYV